MWEDAQIGFSLGKGDLVRMLRYGFALIAALVFSGFTNASWAVTVFGDFSGPDYNSPGVTLVNGEGSGAYFVSDLGINPPYGPNQRLRITGNTTSGAQRGNAWLNQDTYRADGAWDFNFTMQITYPVGGGADGMGFHMHEAGLSADTWIRGEGLGSTFLSIGFDTWNNGGDSPEPGVPQDARLLPKGGYTPVFKVPDTLINGSE